MVSQVLEIFNLRERSRKNLYVPGVPRDSGDPNDVGIPVTPGVLISLWSLGTSLPRLEGPQARDPKKVDILGNPTIPGDVDITVELGDCRDPRDVDIPVVTPARWPYCNINKNPPPP